MKKQESRARFKPPIFRALLRISCGLLVPFVTTVANAAERQVLRGHVVRAVTELHLSPVGTLASSTNLDLVIGLPLRNPESLAHLLQQQYAPTSPQYHHWLTPDEFTAKFGPTEEDYQAVIEFAKMNGFTVTGKHPNRTLVDVRGSVADIERTFRVTLLEYQHPTEHREFHAPDAEPSVDLTVPILHIGGLDNYRIPRPLSIRETSHHPAADATPASGSGPSGNYQGNDFRSAYAPGVSLSGSGQVVGLVEFDGYYANDITKYTRQAKLPSAFLTNVLVDGADGTPNVPDQVLEVSLDIEMVISMAPELDEVVVYEAPQQSDPADVLNQIATDNLARQISCSWFFGDDDSFDQIYEQFAAQGQSFFQASGDNGGFNSDWPYQQQTDSPYITLVGGTELTTGSGAAWRSETVWNWNTGTGPRETNDASGGGISPNYPIPTWQQEVNMAFNQGSTFSRNVPDVAMAAANVCVIYNNGATATDIGGTSVAAPLWAGFTALVNEQAATNQQPPAGFINPAIYAIGMGSNYTACFHDIKTGNNETFYSPSQFSAVTGYDLCTGWGTPTGSNLINALVGTTNMPFAALCRDVTTNADVNCEADVPVSAVDNGSYSTVGTIVSRTLSPPGPYPRGVTQVTLSIADSRENWSSCIAFVTVVDETPPSITCPEAVVTNVPAGVTKVAVSYPTPPASGSCGLQTISCTPASGSIFRLGTTPVVCTATDVAGNTNTCTFNVTVAQGGTNACLFTLKPTSITLPAKGGSKQVGVNAQGTDCSWTAVSHDPFITITSVTNGMGNGKVVYTVPGNTNTGTLTGTMTIAGQTFTVNQAAGGCTFSLSPKSAKYSFAGGSEIVKVKANFSDCAWTAVSTDSFVTINGRASGVGNGTFSYTVAGNTNTAPLNGTITIGGDTFTITQSAAP
ncbi:MAG: protease pro-enzyme activation domain-containing protein [Verrucomicrobiia bacterium]